jgi:hypothetical protein
MPRFAQSRLVHASSGVRLTEKSANRLTPAPCARRALHAILPPVVVLSRKSLRASATRAWNRATLSRWRLRWSLPLIRRSNTRWALRQLRQDTGKRFERLNVFTRTQGSQLFQARLDSDRACIRSLVIEHLNRRLQKTETNRRLSRLSDSYAEERL